MHIIKQQPDFDRRTRTKKEIKQLISERNAVLSQYYNLSNHVELFDDVETLQELLQEFCEVMIDYIATGHFEIYRRIEDGVERRYEIMELSDEVYHEIINTTKVAIRFNDLYDLSNEMSPEMLKKFPQQLSELGENLAIRIELEDKYINTLLCSRPRLAYSAN